MCFASFAGSLMRRRIESSLQRQRAASSDGFHQSRFSVVVCSMGHLLKRLRDSDPCR